MKKVLFLLILLLLLPITVFAKTPTLDETLKVISEINNVEIVESITIQSARVDGNTIYFTIFSHEEPLQFTFEDNTFSFYGGSVLLDWNNQVIGEIYDNDYASFLYMVLENKSSIPYDFNNYYSTNGIKEIINRGFNTDYKEPTNTFGFSLIKPEDSPFYDYFEHPSNEYKIVYHYYLDGDYPILSSADSEGELENPATGNYSVLITIMLISVMCIGIYSYVNREKKN